jgi:WD40 repeat protein
LSIFGNQTRLVIFTYIGFEGCTALSLCQSDLDQDSSMLCPPQLKTFSLLLGATNNGHILVFGRGGKILDRYQLHLGAITQIIFDESACCLFTSGLDDFIRISTIRPLQPDIIQIKIEIQTNFVPRLLCPMGNIIAATADDASIHMFEFNLTRQEWRILSGHPKMQDHTQQVNTLICCPSLGIFLSSGKDSTLRIWNHKNKLLREIYFQEPIGSICLANEKGDVLLALGNRIDLLRNNLCIYA